MTCLITCLNERPEISRILMHTFARLNHETTGLIGFAAVHTDADEALCMKYGIKPVRVARNIAGEKFNAALAEGLKTDASEFLIMGDDDSISTKGFNLLLRAIARGHHHVGFKRNYFVDTASDEAIEYTQAYQCDKLIGAGTMITRTAIINSTWFAETQAVNAYSNGPMKVTGNQIWPIPVARHLDGMAVAKVIREFHEPLWPMRGNGLDYAREMRLTMCGYPPMAVDDDRTHITDFKSHNNIWPFERVKMKWPGKKVEKKSAMWYLSEYEISYICAINKK